MGELTIRLVKSEADMKAARELRARVFVMEQNVTPEEEFDGLDDDAVHAIAILDGKVIGTGRLLEIGRNQFKIGRMAVEHDMRRNGIGSSVLAALEEQARLKGATQVMLHAQMYVKGFYKMHEYLEEGQPFVEAKIEHIVMRKNLCH